MDIKLNDKNKDELQTRMNKALDAIFSYGGIDGAHHKQWTLDQVVKFLTGDEYESWIKYYEQGEDGPQTYSWDKGISP